MGQANQANQTNRRSVLFSKLRLLIIFVPIFFLLSMHLPIAKAYYPKTFSTNLTRIGFGSCLDQNRGAPIFQALLNTPMDLWIWMGDSIYGDRLEEGEVLQATPEELKLDYRKLFNSSQYSDFRKSRPIIGVWDDHDYGVNNGGKEYSFKEQSQQEYLNFLEEPIHSARRSQQGVYTSYIFGENDRRVKIILLDGRYFRDDPNTITPLEYFEHSGIITNIPTLTLLGERQWEWLEKEVSQKDADLLLVVSGIQVLFPYRAGESWGQFPHEQQRLLTFLEKSPIQNIILLSGDKHIGSLFRKDFQNGKIIYDITSSGMNNAAFSSPWYHKANIAATILEKLLGEEQFYGKNNFGFLEIDWEKRVASIAIHNEMGETTKVSASLLLKEK